LTLVKDGFAGVVDTSKKFFYCVNQWSTLKLKKGSLTGVADTSKKYLIGVNETGNICFARVDDTGKVPK
jgi:hypothetical protein